MDKDRERGMKTIYSIHSDSLTSVKRPQNNDCCLYGVVFVYFCLPKATLKKKFVSCVAAGCRYVCHWELFFFFFDFFG